MTRRKELDTFKTGPRTRHGRKCKSMIDTAAIRAGRDHARRQQSFDFGREQKPVALASPIKRSNTKTIASELKLPFSFIPKRDGKLPSQPFPHPFVMIFPQVR